MVTDRNVNLKVKREKYYKILKSGSGYINTGEEIREDWVWDYDLNLW